MLEPAAPDACVNSFVSPAPFRQHFDYSRDGVRRSLDDSFARLGVERLDVVLVHDVGAATHGPTHPAILRQVLDEALPTLHAARDAGQVGLIGLGVNEWQVCVEVLERAPLDVIMLAGRFTLFEQGALTSGLLDLCLERNVPVIAAGVFNSGLFAERPNPQSPYDYETAPDDVRARALALWQACERHGVTPQAAAVQFPFTHRAVTTVVVGARSADRGGASQNVARHADRAGSSRAALRREGHLGEGG